MVTANQEFFVVNDLLVGRCLTPVEMGDGVNTEDPPVDWEFIM
jgi:hypothetical protein